MLREQRSLREEPDSAGPRLGHQGLPCLPLKVLSPWLLGFHGAGSAKVRSPATGVQGTVSRAGYIPASLECKVGVAWVDGLPLRSWLQPPAVTMEGSSSHWKVPWSDGCY